MHLRRSFLQFLTAASASPFDRGLDWLEVSKSMSLSVQNDRNSWHRNCGPPSALTTEGNPNSSHQPANVRITAAAVVEDRPCTKGYPEYRSTMMRKSRPQEWNKSSPTACIGWEAVMGASAATRDLLGRTAAHSSHFSTASETAADMPGQ